MACYEIDGVVPVVDPTAFVHESASLIGDVIVGAGCYIGPFASLRGDFGRITVGAGSNVQDSVTIHAFPGADAVLEPNSHIGHGVVLHGCTVRSYALIGIGSIVLDGAEIGADSMLGAGSLVTAGTVIPPRSLALGRPAAVVRELDEETLAWKRNGTGIYQALAERSLATLRRVEPLAAVQRDRPRVSTTRELSIPLHERKLARGESQ